VDEGEAYKGRLEIANVEPGAPRQTGDGGEGVTAGRV
jgi:hypothetical protein